jgi:hypothetical protein
MLLVAHIQSTNLVSSFEGFWILNFSESPKNADHVNVFFDRPGGFRGALTEISTGYHPESCWLKII